MRLRMRLGKIISGLGASTSCTDGAIVRCLVDAKTAERSGESGEMIEPEEDP